MSENQNAYKGGFRAAWYFCGRCHGNTGRFIVTGTAKAHIPAPHEDGGFTAFNVSFECCENCMSEVFGEVVSAINGVSEQVLSALSPESFQAFVDLVLGAMKAKPCTHSLESDQREDVIPMGIPIHLSIRTRIAKMELRPLITLSNGLESNSPAQKRETVACSKCLFGVLENAASQFSNYANTNPRFDETLVREAVKSVEFPFCGGLNT